MALFRPETATGTSSYAGTAETASYAFTASFITASGVFGPFGSSSVESASYALTASYALNAGTPGGSDTQIQFNSGSEFSGSTNFTFDYINNTVLLTGSISASYGPSTVGFYGTASWAVSASRAISASFADIAAGLVPGTPIPVKPPEYAVQFNSGSFLSGSEYFLYKYPSQSLEQGQYVTASGPWSHAQGYSTLAAQSHSHAEGYWTTASGLSSHAEGYLTWASGAYSHAEGMGYYSSTTTETLRFTGLVRNAASIGDNFVTFRSTEPMTVYTGISTPTPGMTLQVIETGFYSESVTITSFVSVPNFGFTQYYIYFTPTLTNGYSGYDKIAGYRTTFRISTFETITLQSQSIAYGSGSHTEGFVGAAAGNASHNEGWETIAYSSGSHAEGYRTIAGGFGLLGKAVGPSNSTQSLTIFDIDLTPYLSQGDFVYYVRDDVGVKKLVSIVTAPTFGTLLGQGYTVIDVAPIDTFVGNVDIFPFWGRSYQEFPPSNQSAASPASLPPFYVENNGNLGPYGFYKILSGSTTNPASGFLKNPYAHAEGDRTYALGIASHAEGSANIAIGHYSHAEGLATTAFGEASHAEASYNRAFGPYSHAEGEATLASGYGSHTEGVLTLASGTYSHAEGEETTAKGQSSHAEGYRTTASGSFSHAEGGYTYVVNLGKISYTEYVSGGFALGAGSHAEGGLTLASGLGSHAEGYMTTASGFGSHAEGELSVAYGYNTHAGGLHTIASASYTTTVGQYNLHNNTIDLFTIGDGADDSNRHDLLNAGIGYVKVSGSAVVSSSLEVIGLATVTGSAIISSSLTTIGINTTTGSAIVSSSLTVIGVSSVTGSNNITGSWTLIGAGQVTGSLDITGSYSLIGAGVVTGSLRVTGSLVANYANLTGSLTGSFFGTGSGDFDGQFIGRFTGSATGSFIGTGSGDFDGRFIGSFTGSATGSFIGTSSGHFDGIFTGSNSNGVSFYGTSSWAVSASYITGSVFDSTNPVLSASYAESSSYALSASYSVTSSYAESASYSLSSSYSVTSSYAESASYALSASYSVTSSYAESASYALSSSYSVTSSYAESASYSLSSSYSVTSSYAESSSYALSASYSVTSSHAVSALTTASVSLNDITFYKGDGTQFVITVDTGSGGGPGGDFVPSSWTGSTTSYFAGTASYATYSLSSSFAETASAINVILSSNTNERLPVILAYTSSNSGAKLAYIDAGFDYNTSTNALYLPSNGAVIVGNTTIQSSVATFGSAGNQNHVVLITGSLNVSKSVNVDGTVTANNYPNVTGFIGTASWAVSASHVSGAFMQGGNSFGAGAILGTNDLQDLSLETNGTTRMFISSSGMIWIGGQTTQQFAGTNATIQLYAGASVNNSVALRSSQLLLYPPGSNTTASIILGSNGLAAWTLRNQGMPVFQIRSTPGGGTSNTVMQFSSGSDGQYRVGIMTESPQHTFDVSGSACITGSFYLPGVTSSPYGNVLIIDTGSGQVYVTASSAIGGGGVPGGALRSIQFNSASVFSGSSNFSFDETTNSVFVTGSLTVSGSSTFTNIGPAVFSGSVNITGSIVITGSTATTGDVEAGGYLKSLQSSGDEGGEIFLAQAQTNSTLAGGITIDSYQNKIRFFEQGGSARGAYIDLTACAGGAGTNLLSPGGGATFNGGTNVDNRLITATGTSPELNGESNLTFDGSTLTVVGNITASSFTGSLQGTASYVTGALFTNTNPALSASYALTASYAANVLTYSSNEGIYNSGNTFKLGDNSSIGAYLQVPFTEDRYIDFGDANNSLFFTKQSSFMFKLSGSGQLVLNQYTTSTKFQGSSGASIGVLHTDNTGRIFVSSSGTSFTYNSTSSVIGDGAATSFNINHGFNTRNLHITVYESGSNGETVYPDIRRINDNTASIIFANPPTSLQYIVYVSQ